MRKTLTAVCALAVWLMFVPAWAQPGPAPQPQPQPPAPERAVTGVVKDAATSMPLANMTVVVVETGETVTSAADGTFTVKASGQVTLRVTGTDYQQADLVVDAAALTADVALSAVPKRVITGLLEKEDTGEPIVGAQVIVLGTQTSTVTDQAGFFVLTGVSVDAVTIRISASNVAATEVVVAANINSVRAKVTTTDPPPAPTTRTITGTVMEKGGNEPVVSATVEVVGTDVVVIGEADGTFVIPDMPAEVVTLKISGVGYDEQILLVQPESNTVSAELTLGASSETIFVTGRAPAIVKLNLANGASVVKSDDLTNVTSDNVTSAMQGKVSGANIQSNSGAPGGGMQISLRGVSTINGRSTPLYVIDGVLVQDVAIANGLNAITGSAGGSSASNQDNPVNRIADLDPNSIASIEVLKGASAAALYGNKASNGVIIITTKRGQAGKPRINITQRLGFSQAANRLGFREFSSIEEARDTFGAGVTDEQFSATPFDHEAAVFGERALAHETVAEMSGGDKNRTYIASFLLRDTPGLLKNTGYQKQSGRLALEQRIGDKLKVRLSSNFIHSNTQRGISNNDNTFTTPYFVLGGTPTFYDIRPNDRGGFDTPNPFIPSGTNPLQTAELMTANLNDEEVYRTISSANVGYDIFDKGTSSLSANGIFGYDFFNYASTLFTPPEAFFEGADGLLGTSVNTDAESENFNLGANLVYKYTPKSGKLKSATTLGFTYESRRVDTVLVVSQNQNAGQPNIDQGSQTAVNHTRSLARDNGFYVQEELQLLDERLSLIGATLFEANSNNGNGDQYNFFPKVGAVYKVPGLPKDFDSLRVRAAYGESGNQPNATSRFTALTASSNLGGDPALIPGTQVGDPNIRPERQREFDGGIDLVGFDNRLVLELGGYYRAISDMLHSQRLGGSSGFITQTFNGGGMRNFGVEAMLQVEPVKTSNFNWLSRTIFTLNRNKITDLPVPAFNAGGFGTGLGAFRIEEGQAATQIVGNVPDGMGGTTVMKIGDATPDFRMTFVNNVEYKTEKTGTFGFSTLLDWQKGSDVINLSQFIIDIFRNDDDFRDDNVGDGDSLDAIAQACGEGERRRESGPVNGNDTREYVEDASFLRIREFKLFWSLPDRLAKKFGPAETLRLSFSARNLFTFSSYRGLDPEVSNFGNTPVGRNIDVAPYPPNRVFWFSLTAGF